MKFQFVSLVLLELSDLIVMREGGTLVLSLLTIVLISSATRKPLMKWAD